MKDKIIEALKNVFDPEIPVDIYNLGLIYDIRVNGGAVEIDMTMTSPTCPMAEEIMDDARRAAESVPGVNDIKINLVWDPPWEISHMSDEARLELDLMDAGW